MFRERIIITVAPRPRSVHRAEETCRPTTWAVFCCRRQSPSPWPSQVSANAVCADGLDRPFELISRLFLPRPAVGATQSYIQVANDDRLTVSSPVDVNINIQGVSHSLQALFAQVARLEAQAQAQVKNESTTTSPAPTREGGYVGAFQHTPSYPPHAHRCGDPTMRCTVPTLPIW